MCYLLYVKRFCFFLNWDSLHAMLNSHCKAWSYMKKKHKKIKAYRKSLYKELTVNRCLLILDLKPFASNLHTLAFNLHLHLQVSCHSMYLVSLVLDIRLITVTFMFLTTSGIENFAYGSLILLQLPLHLFTLTL